jgi:hypothetical protein
MLVDPARVMATSYQFEWHNDAPVEREQFKRDTFTTQVNWNVELSLTRQEAGEGVKSYSLEASNI